MAKKYIGITIGPIFDTINLTSSPKTLWASSFMFSLLSKCICDTLIEDFNLDEKDIITPYYEKDGKYAKSDNGVGLFHDRVIFCCESFSGDMKEVRKNAIDRVAKILGLDNDKDRKYLDKYIMVAYATFEGENPILDSSVMLNSLELAKPYVFEEKENPILSLFKKNNNENEENANGSVKTLIESFKDFQLFKECKKVFKSLKDIAGKYNGYKRRNYFAVLRSDGDNMGKIIASLKSDEEIRAFSKKCLDFCYNASLKVKEFGGATVYAGGDDLLALLPCEANGKTVFEFISTLNGFFNESFEEYVSKYDVSLSFGVTVTYYKFPLYESLDASANLLFNVAKKKKNCTAFLLQKHSGQSEGLVISNNSLKEWCSLVDINANDEVLLSSMHKLSLFKGAFDIAKEENVENIFVNTFDSMTHEDNKFVHKRLPDLFNTLSNGKTDICALSENNVMDKNTVITLHNMSRIMKFFVEKGGEA